MELNRQYEFGPYRIETESKLLLRDSERIPLTPKVFDLLLVLVEAQGQVLNKETLLARVWPDTFVEETNLTKGISVLRSVLGEGYIETLPKRGYRFTVEVRSSGAADLSSTVGAGVRTEGAPAIVGSGRVVWLAAAAVLVAAVSGWWYFGRPKAEEPFKSLAVLPFVNLSQDAGQEYFSDGLTEEIINALTPTPGLRVVARTSAFQFKGKKVDIREVGEKLGAEAILEGSIRVDGDRLRVTAQLNNARDGYLYWSRSWDHSMKDVLAVQSDVAREVARAMGQSGGGKQTKALTRNLEAYDLYLRGMYYRSRIGQFAASLDAFEGALKLDPHFAAARANIAGAYIVEAGQGRIPRNQALPKIRENAAQALSLDPELPLAHATAGMIAFQFDWDFKGAEVSFRRALELNPADPAAHHNYAHFLTAMGRFEEAMVHSRTGLELDPLNLSQRHHMVEQLYYLGDAHGAIAAAQPVLNLEPNHALTHVFLELSYSELGDYRKAAAEMAKHPFRPGVPAKALAGFERSGAEGYWRVLYDATRSSAGLAGVRLYNSANDSARLGLTDEALGWIEKCIEVRDPFIVYLAVDPPFKKLRGLPRFQGLLRRIGLPQGRAQ